MPALRDVLVCVRVVQPTHTPTSMPRPGAGRSRSCTGPSARRAAFSVDLLLFLALELGRIKSPFPGRPQQPATAPCALGGCGMLQQAL